MVHCGPLLLVSQNCTVHHSNSYPALQGRLLRWVGRHLWLSECSNHPQAGYCTVFYEFLKVPKAFAAFEAWSEVDCGAMTLVTAALPVALSAAMVPVLWPSEGIARLVMISI